MEDASSIMKTSKAGQHENIKSRAGGPVPALRFSEADSSDYYFGFSGFSAFSFQLRAFRAFRAFGSQVFPVSLFPVFPWPRSPWPPVSRPHILAALCPLTLFPFLFSPIFPMKFVE
ncbi:MAG: hypothetical protein FJ126_02550 [Deltaproteobacteria bacterium]|nr:hypothetical protein [Deltaproteobacteria bacterium]